MTTSLVGIFGGTFDPIHCGHLRIAEEIVGALDLREMRFMPAGIPRLRQPPIASPQQRAAMVRMAIQGNARLVLDEREIKRPGTSVTVESLRELKQELGENVALCFVTGADAFMKLDQWHRWRELFGLCHFIIAARPGHALKSGHDTLPQTLRNECTPRWVSSADQLKNTTNGLIFVAPTTLLDVSASALRARIAAKENVRDLLPDAVLDYIETNRLYLKANKGKNEAR